MYEATKTGAGAYRLKVNDDGSVGASTHLEGDLHRYASPQAAYDHYHPFATDGQGNHAAWNLCYILEDFISGDREA